MHNNDKMFSKIIKIESIINANNKYKGANTRQ